MSNNKIPARAFNSTVVALLAIIAIILTGWMLKATRTVMVPLTLALFIVVLVQPVQEWLCRKLPPRLSALSIALTMVLIVAVLALGAGAVWLAVESASEKAPEYGRKLIDGWERVTEWAKERKLPVSDSADLPKLAGRAAGSWLVSAASAITGLVLVFFLALLMLIEARIWREKAAAATEGSSARRFLGAVEVICNKIRQYFYIRIVIGVASGIVAAVWLWIAGLDFIWMWGLLTFALNFIPNIGAVLSVVLPTAQALAQGGSTRILLVGCGLTAIHQFIGNYVEPRVEGKRLAISPVVIFVSVLLWGWIWGPVGTVVGVPITVTLIIVCAHVAALRPIALMLSDTADEEALDEQTGAGEEEADRRKPAA
ncbi:MAG: AI-2E family transporter [Bryobacteraceae bacterium]|nr:AI-2E family transporter [Bryobacteraceae bacterium]